jgi:hypothetical protein
VEAIVGARPAAWDARRAQSLGLHGDPDFESIVRAFVED